MRTAYSDLTPTRALGSLLIPLRALATLSALASPFVSLLTDPTPCVGNPALVFPARAHSPRATGSSSDEQCIYGRSTSYTHEVCLTPGPHQLELTDSMGYGWMGAEIAISQRGGEEIYRATIPTSPGCGYECTLSTGAAGTCSEHLFSSRRVLCADLAAAGCECGSCCIETASDFDTFRARVVGLPTIDPSPSALPASIALYSQASQRFVTMCAQAAARTLFGRQPRSASPSSACSLQPAASPSPACTSVSPRTDAALVFVGAAGAPVGDGHGAGDSDSGSRAIASGGVSDGSVLPEGLPDARFAVVYATAVPTADLTTGRMMIALWSPARRSYLSIDNSNLEVKLSARVSRAARFVPVDDRAGHLSLWNPASQRFLRMGTGTVYLDAGAQHAIYSGTWSASASLAQTERFAVVHAPLRVGNPHVSSLVHHFEVTPPQTIPTPLAPPPLFTEVARFTVACSGPSLHEAHLTGLNLTHLRAYAVDVNAVDQAGNPSRCGELSGKARGRRTIDGLSQRAVIVDVTPPHPTMSNALVKDRSLHLDAPDLDADHIRALPLSVSCDWSELSVADEHSGLQGYMWALSSDGVTDDVLPFRDVEMNTHGGATMLGPGSCNARFHVPPPRHLLHQCHPCRHGFLRRLLLHHLRHILHPLHHQCHPCRHCLLHCLHPLRRHLRRPRCRPRCRRCNHLHPLCRLHLHSSLRPHFCHR